MKLLILMKQSIKAIFANKGRSFLTVLGIVIGIGSVIALMALGSGVKEYISKQIGALGTTTLTVSPGAEIAQATSGSSSGGVGGGQRGGSGGFSANVSSLTVSDYNSLLDKTKTPDLKSVVGVISGTGIYNDQRFEARGVNPEIFSIRNLQIDKGVLLSDADVTSKAKSVVIGSDAANNLFGTNDPLGKTLTLGNDTYTVIGLLKKSNENNFNNPNSTVYIPYTSAIDSFGSDKFSNFTIEANSDSVVDKAKTEIQDTLLANHNIKDLKLADFSVSTSADLLSTVGSITGILTSLLAGIAAISLLVGGIGIMNIMLVSVTERTREIGLRKAVGARTSDILTQFLIEAILLTLVGGLLGIGLGWLMAAVAGHFVGFSPVLTRNAIILAVGISTVIGIIFGIYPAGRAAKLNPIDALRYE